MKLKKLYIVLLILFIGLLTTASISLLILSHQNLCNIDHNKRPDKKITIVPNKEIDNFILSKAEKNQVVIFGEYHTIERDNLYVTHLLPKLKKIGYKYFAFELGISLEPLINKFCSNKITQKELIKRLSAEVIGPEHIANIIAAAHKLGFKIVIYDDWKHVRLNCIMNQDREDAGFKNLEKKIFGQDLDAKVIVYAGRLHIFKKPILYTSCLKESFKLKTIACLLNKYTEGKVLSISLLEVNHLIDSQEANEKYENSIDIGIQVRKDGTYYLVSLNLLKEKNK